MQRRHILTGLGSVGEAGMSPFVPTWAVAFCGGLLLAATIAAYSKELRTAGAWLFRSPQKRQEDIARRVFKEEEAKSMRRLAEAVALRYVDDPQKRGRMADELSEEWEKERRAARHSDDEQPQ